MTNVPMLVETRLGGTIANYVTLHVCDKKARPIIRNPISSFEIVLGDVVEPSGVGGSGAVLSLFHEVGKPGDDILGIAGVGWP